MLSCGTARRGQARHTHRERDTHTHNSYTQVHTDRQTHRYTPTPTSLILRNDSGRSFWMPGTSQAATTASNIFFSPGLPSALSVNGGGGGGGGVWARGGECESALSVNGVLFVVWGRVCVCVSCCCCCWWWCPPTRGDKPSLTQQERTHSQQPPLPPPTHTHSQQNPPTHPR